MNIHEFIKANIGNKVYLSGDGDLAMSSELRPFISNKEPLTLMRLNKKGMAIVEDSDGNTYSVPPRNINLHI